MDEYGSLIQPDDTYSVPDSLQLLEMTANATGIPYPRVYVRTDRWSSGVIVVRPGVALRCSTWRVRDYLSARGTDDDYANNMAFLTGDVTDELVDPASMHPEVLFRLVRFSEQERVDLRRVLLPLVVKARYPERMSLADYDRINTAGLHTPQFGECRAAKVLGERVSDLIKRLRNGDTRSNLSDEYDEDSLIDDDNVFGALYCYSQRVGVDRAERVLYTINDKLDAWASRSIVLLHCGHFGLRFTAHSTEDGYVCRQCLEEDYVMLGYDDAYVHRDNAYYWESDGEYHRESEPDEDEYSEDEDDPDDSNPDRLMDYSTNVMQHLSVDHSFVSRADGDFHMGVELETILTQGGTNDKVYSVRCELGDDYLVAKYDGSLGDSAVSGSGIEWVTQPTSLKRHVEKLGNWGASAKHLVAWDAKCCGMHVHIDSRAFTASTLGKMLQFYNMRDNVEFIRRIAGRHPDVDRQAQHYAGRDVPHESVFSPTKALKDKDSNRYTMVNLSNLGRRESDRLKLSKDRSFRGSSNTVEVRIFRASMRRERLLAQLEFTHGLIVFCRQAGYRNLTSEDFTVWLTKNTSSYPRLAKFLGVRPHKHGAQRATPHQPAQVDEVVAVDPDLAPVPAPRPAFVSTLELETALNAAVEAVSGIPQVMWSSEIWNPVPAEPIEDVALRAARIQREIEAVFTVPSEPVF